MRDVIASLQHVGRDESPHVDALCAVNPYFWAREWLNGLQYDRTRVAEPPPKAEQSDDVHGATDVLHRQAGSVISSVFFFLHIAHFDQCCAGYEPHDHRRVKVFCRLLWLWISIIIVGFSFWSSVILLDVVMQ